MKKLLPVILVVLGAGGGLGAGILLKPASEPEEGAAPCTAGDSTCMAATAMTPAPVMAEPYDTEKEWDYVKLPKQFVIPIIRKERVAALVVMTLSLEVEAGTSDAVLTRAPKLKDGFLQVMFEHANSGGFDGAFTTGQSMKDLRGSLNEVATRYLGDIVHDVLIEEIVKQET